MQIDNRNPITHHDLTTLRRTEKRLRLMVENLPAGAVYREGDTLILNKAVENIIGYERSDVDTIETWFTTLFGKEAPYVRDRYEQDRAAGFPAARTLPLTHRDGTRRFVTFAGYRAEHDEVWLLQDITDQIELERAVLQVSECEQRRIGQDLHDGLGAHLTAVAMLCRTLGRRLENDKAVTPNDLNEVADLIQEGITTARSLARGLNPVRLESRGLACALQELANGLELRTGLRFRFETDRATPAFDDAVAVQLYRIAQEATTNALKHARAQEVVVSLNHTGTSTILRIQDDGIGLSPDNEPWNGIGIKVMHYRADHIGATLSIAATPNQGTIITCTLPDHAHPKTPGP